MHPPPAVPPAGTPGAPPLTCSVVLWSEKGELKNVVTMLMTISVTYFSKMESACFRSLVLLQACRTRRVRHPPKPADHPQTKGKGLRVRISPLKRER